MRRTQGFTLLELIVGISMSAILLVLGVPAYTSSVRQNCVSTGANSFLVALTLARSEALRRDGTVTICKSSDGAQCSRAAGTGWQQGFLMFVESAKIGTLESGETVLRAEAPISTCGSLSTNRYTNYISFDGSGKVNSNGSFFLRANGDASVVRTVTLFVNRVRVCTPPTDRTCPTP